MMKAHASSFVEVSHSRFTRGLMQQHTAAIIMSAGKQSVSWYSCMEATYALTQVPRKEVAHHRRVRTTL